MPTVNKQFGLADPQYDALRVLSAQGLQPGPGDGSTIIGGGLENKIYLWPSDGSTISTYDPDDSGLTSALAAAASGDTVWLPSIPIALTAAITVPAGVTLRGISDKATLNFSGFSGTAITLLTGAALVLFSMTMISNGTTAIGVDNSADDSIMIHVNVQVSGGSSSNIAIGQSSVIAKEIWQLHLATGEGKLITWSNTYDFADSINDTTWNLIDSFPVGFDDVSLNDLNVFAINPDGSEFFIAKGSNIWRCTNVPAIRAAPATTPTYALIADSSTPIGEWTLDNVNNIIYWSDRLCAMVKTSSGVWAYGEYSSGAWTWYGQPISGAGNYHIAGQRTMRGTGIAIDHTLLYNTLTLTTVYDFTNGFGEGGNKPLWRNHDQSGSRVITILFHNVNNTKIVNETGAVLQDVGSRTDGYSVNGALYGASAFVILADGTTFISSDGTTFSAGAALGTGELRDAYYSGGGPIIWVGNPANGDPVSKNSLDGGSTFNDKSGDFMTVTGGSLLGFTLHGMGLVF